MQRAARLRLLASAIAGQGVEIAMTDGLSWTDGTTIYVDAQLSETEERVRAIAVQASLIAAGSLASAKLRAVPRGRRALRAYLAAEARRALELNAAVLPLVGRSLVAELTDDPAPVFGQIDPRRVRDDDGPEVGQLLSSPVGKGGPISKLLQRLFRPSRGGRGGAPRGDAPIHFSRDPLGAGQMVVAPPPSRIRGIDAQRNDGVTYPEWDVHRQRYRPDWCTVVETDAATKSGVAPALAQSHAMRRALARLGVGLAPVRRRAQGDDIDIDAAIENRVLTLVGQPARDDSYVETIRQRRELSVLVLLDVSGSANEPGTSGQRVHDHQVAAAAALTEALHDLGDRVALYAFNSRGREAVQVVRVTTFDAPLDSRAMNRLASLEPAAYTRLGAAIRHGATVLERGGGTPRRLLVVLSDGFAYDHGYEGHYGEADAARALLEARRRGIGCLCLSVGADADAAALRRVFGPAAHASVPRVDDLGSLIGPLFRSAIERKAG